MHTNDTSEIAITVGIPSYRGAKTLATTVRSVAEALMRVPVRGREIIVCINGDSTETTVAAQAWLTSYSGLVKVICCEVPSKATAMNMIVKHATGDVVFFVDDDVILERDCLLQSYRKIETNQEIKLVFADRAVVQPIRGNALRRWFYSCLTFRYRHQIFCKPDTFVNGSCMGIRRVDYPQLPPDVINDDQYLHIFFWGRVQKVPEAVYFFHGISSLQQYCRRYGRIAHGRAQMRSYFVEDQIKLYEELVQRRINSSRVSSLTFSQRVQFAVWKSVDSVAGYLHRLAGKQYDGWTRNSHDHQSDLNSLRGWLLAERKIFGSVK
jgi:glycosyltransferase involved in cell wall biosynthesis